MPPPPNNEADNALYIVKLVFGDDQVIKLKVKKGKKRIDAIMDDATRTATGIAKLGEQELTNLNSWLDVDKVVAPGHTD